CSSVCAVNVEAGANSSTWSSCALSTAVMATKASPPGLFSTTTGCPHFAASLSATNRAVISTPEPGPRWIIKRTGRWGQCGPDVCACAESAATIAKRQNETVKNKLRKRCMMAPGVEAPESRHNSADYAITE